MPRVRERGRGRGEEGGGSYIGGRTFFGPRRCRGRGGVAVAGLFSVCVCVWRGGGDSECVFVCVYVCGCMTVYICMYVCLFVCLYASESFVPPIYIFISLSPSLRLPPL